MPVAELDFGVHDEMIRVEKPLRYDLAVEKLHDAVLRHRLVAAGSGLRVRPLPEEVPARAETGRLGVHLPLEGEDKVPVDNDCVDLTPFVREDMLLEFPQHPLCKPDCAGLRKKVPARPGKPPARMNPKPSAWAVLDKLKLKF